MLRWKTELRCKAKPKGHPVNLVAVTGGPGAGKSAVLEFASRIFCPHVVELPEAASIVFGGGFWRKDTVAAKKAAQRAIYHVQRELERMVQEEDEAGVVLCDRGTVDGFAYWPDTKDDYWSSIGVKREQEILRYLAVIHLRPPSADNGYNHKNYLRIESATEASEIDRKIEEAWSGHPRRYFVDSKLMFVEKVAEAIRIIESIIPPDCLKTSKRS